MNQPVIVLHAIILAILGILFQPVWAATEIVIIMDDAYPPYSYSENGEGKGIYVDYIREVAKHLPEYSIKFVPLPWKRGLNEMQKGSSFVLIPPYKDKERTFLQYSEVPLFEETISLFCTEEVKMKGATKFPQDFSGLNIGINLGFVLGEKMDAAVKQNLFTLRETKGNENNLRLLAAKAIDCYANDRVSVLASARKFQSDSRFPELRTLVLHETATVSQINAYVAFSVSNQHPQKADFIEKLNSSLREHGKKKTIAAILAQYK